MKEIVNKFLKNIKCDIISTLERENVLSKKLYDDFGALEKYLKEDEKNILVIIDILAYSYLSDVSSLDNLKLRIPQSLLDTILARLNQVKSKNINLETSESKKIVIEYVKSAVLSLLKNIFKTHHRVSISFPLPLPSDDLRGGPLVLLLTEHLYRHHFVNLSEINTIKIKQYMKNHAIKSKNKNDNDVMTRVVECASTIKKRDNGKENKTGPMAKE